SGPERSLAGYAGTRSWPTEKRSGVAPQARRAALSAAANIAGGSAKRGRREFIRYLDITIGSLSELSYVFRLAHDLNVLVGEDWEELSGLRARAGFLSWRLYEKLRGTHGDGKR